VPSTGATAHRRRATMQTLAVLRRVRAWVRKDPDQPWCGGVGRRAAPTEPDRARARSTISPIKQAALIEAIDPRPARQGDPCPYHGHHPKRAYRSDAHQPGVHHHSCGHRQRARDGGDVRTVDVPAARIPARSASALPPAQPPALTRAGPSGSRTSSVDLRISTIVLMMSDPFYAALVDLDRRFDRRPVRRRINPRSSRYSASRYWSVPRSPVDGYPAACWSKAGFNASRISSLQASARPGC